MLKEMTDEDRKAWEKLVAHCRNEDGEGGGVYGWCSPIGEDDDVADVILVIDAEVERLNRECDNLRGQIEDYTTVGDVERKGYLDEIKCLREIIDLLPGWIHTIKIERMRQDAKWGEQNHNDWKWLTILTEEIGELAKCILEDDSVNGVKELGECAAVCVAWMEAIGRRPKEG
jgi:hypothetical protein